MAAADVEEFIAAPVFWIKMGLVVLLLINGLMMQRTEARLTSGAHAAWQKLRVHARLSMALWLLIATLGIILAGS
ncbi:MAG: hypothetical protein ABIS27_07220, partial [Longimicrobiales bacterium]